MLELFKYFLWLVLIFCAIYLVGHMKIWTHPDPFTEMKMELCTGGGLAPQAEALSPRERKQIAAVCAAYHLGAYQLTGLDVYMDIFFTYGKKYLLTIQDIDAERWPNKTANTFFSEMQGIGYELVTLPAAEKEERLIAWRIIAQTYFKEAYKAGIEAKPAKLLTLVPKAIHIAR